MKKNWFSALAIIAAMAAFNACTTYAPHSASMTGTVMVDSDVIGSVEGNASAYRFLGLAPVGDDSLRAATADALSKKGGDALINVTVDRAVTAFPHPAWPIYIKVDTKIVGTAVKLKG